MYVAIDEEEIARRVKKERKSTSWNVACKQVNVPYLRVKGVQREVQGTPVRGGVLA